MKKQITDIYFLTKIVSFKVIVNDQIAKYRKTNIIYFSLF